MTFTVAIVGRPNVGKSTLFNRLIGKRHALVDDTPGVTRDRREGDGRIADLNFKVIDTAGLEDAEAGTLEGRMRVQTERAIVDADLVLMMIDEYPLTCKEYATGSFCSSCSIKPTLPGGFWLDGVGCAMCSYGNGVKKPGAF